jgi:hypothetical protein
MMSDTLIAPRFLFRYSVPCLSTLQAWKPGAPTLGAEYALPYFGQLEGERPFAEVRAAWSAAGLVFQARVSGKTQPPWCRESRPDESDGLRVWIDTRDTHNVHRASRFCHAFIFMPAGAGRALDEPAAEQLLINRAKENARPIRPGVLQASREKRVDGYVLEGFIPAAALHGYDPQEHSKIGFSYEVVDRELGQQVFSSPLDMPYREDPSLWATLELVEQ